MCDQNKASVCKLTRRSPKSVARLRAAHDHTGLTSWRRHGGAPKAQMAQVLQNPFDDLRWIIGGRQ